MTLPDHARGDSVAAGEHVASGGHAQLSRSTELMFAVRWIEAECRMRSRGIADGACSEMARLIAQAGRELEPLQALFQNDPGVASRRDPSAQLLNFVDGDLTDVFRGFTDSASYLLSDSADWLAQADPDEVEGELDLVVRYLDIAVMAAESAAIPDDVRAVFRRAGAALNGWGDRVLRLTEQIYAAKAPPRQKDHEAQECLAPR